MLAHGGMSRPAPLVNCHDIFVLIWLYINKIDLTEPKPQCCFNVVIEDGGS